MRSEHEDQGDHAARRGGSGWWAFLRLARPTQWAKCGFVLIGPAYGYAAVTPDSARSVAGAVLAFALASSACYVMNDLADREADRVHPRKRKRPLASGAVSPGAARVFTGLLLAGAAGGIVLVPGAARLWLAACVALYVLNVFAYTAVLKRAVILDVISLASGFVLRVLGGCAAAGVPPSSWLLNVTFFVSMFLAFGKRLGERRTMGADAAAARSVQSMYTDELLRMAVVVTAVATLLTYSEYVASQAEGFTRGFNLFWLTMLPATYALLRCIVLLERGAYDDPTELAVRDRPFQLSVLLFALLTVLLMTEVRIEHGGGARGVAGPPGAVAPARAITGAERDP
ncbi:MAG: UbiA prenyltransferase family protein [Phycisphaerae bacterium]|nr:UbiA prenyltransferase family protein [Phycisphaerae bacterium]